LFDLLSEVHVPNWKSLCRLFTIGLGLTLLLFRFTEEAIITKIKNFQNIPENIVFQTFMAMLPIVGISIQYQDLDVILLTRAGLIDQTLYVGTIYLMTITIAVLPILFVKLLSLTYMQLCYLRYMLCAFVCLVYPYVTLADLKALYIIISLFTLFYGMLLLLIQIYV